MRIISCKLQNFASYKELEFNFNNQGLTLIQGATGSGKSTLCDIIPWVLFGSTSKGGTVDEVLSWPGNDVTKVTLYLENVTIARSRGSKAKDNDLTFHTAGSEVTRGKDLNDTQKLINNLLGIDYELYLAGAYFHEFSQTAQFFTTTAKNRRTICEQLVDLSLATKLQPRLAENSKELKQYLFELQAEQRQLTSNLALLKKHQEQEETKATDWDKQHDKTMQYVISCYEKFEANRKKVVSKKCNACGTQLEHPKEVVDTSTNPHLARLAELERETNPHDGSVKDFSIEINENLSNSELLNHKETKAKLELEDIELLQDVVADFRSTSIRNTINDLETKTNSLLTEHFDAEIKVNFEVEDADKLGVTIHKDGNVASFTQLSKGQRQLLKLCFGVSVMQCVSNHHGIKFDQIFFDEALDGLDDQMKTKAYGLLLMLSQQYDSLYVVEHSESLKALFENKFTVQLVNGESVIEQV